MLRRLTVWLVLFCMALSVLPVYAEDDGDEDISGWANAQDVADAQIEWADMFGVEVDNTEVASNITKKCKIKVSEGSKDRLTNGKVGSPWKYSHSDAWVGVQLPDDVTPGAIRIEWMFDPTNFDLVQYDGSLNPIRTYTQADTFPSIYMLFPLDPQTKSIKLTLKEKGQSVSNLVVYSAGVLPADVQMWLPPVEKADMMVFSTHQDDEVIFLGGTIPYSDVVCNRPTITVYMTNCSRDRRREALECLWEMGSRHYPEFINFEDEKVSSIEKGVKLWGGRDNILKEMVARIRRYKPEVIVTQDLDGEYGHNQHKVMARAMEPAIQAAADPNQFPDSYNQYGAWQVKKLYLHLYKENPIRMDWLSPQDAFNGESLLDVARRGMAKQVSQTKYYKVKDGGEYDNAKYGLALTTVGEDVQKNDFFENIPYGGEIDETVEEPEATDDGWEDTWPTEEETEAVTENPFYDESPFDPVEDEYPAVEPVPEPVAEKTGGNGALFAGVAAAGAALAGAGAWMLLRRQPPKKKKRRRKGKSKRKSTSKSKGKASAKKRKSGNVTK